ncbi:MAG: hypothetical protein FI703_06385 [SAR202 cluster bacterium]|nr:hypothetical protein [SAR202 cluster bacterium]
MHVTRIYAGSDGKSHFEEVDLNFKPRAEGQSEGTPVSNAKEAFFTRQDVGYVLDWHTAPGRQYVITLSGQGEIEVGDGSKKLFEPGDVLQAEDTTGQGHVTRVVGDHPRTMMWVPLD